MKAMPCFFIKIFSLLIIFCCGLVKFTSAQSVGVGTTTPNASAVLQVDMGSNLTKGFLVTGVYNFNGSSVPDLGSGSRLMFFPGKAAFRVGSITASQWNNSNVGTHSMAFGSNTTASGTVSTALGSNTISSGTVTTSMGALTIASGAYSTTMGLYTLAKGYAGTVVGMFNDPVLTIDELTETPETPMFIVGNGTNTSTRSNALLVLKNGNIGIGTNTPVQTLDLDGRMNISNGVIQRGGTAITNTSDLGLYSRVSGNYLRFVTNGGSTRFFSDDAQGTNANLVIEPNGNVGIGNANPSQRLSVNGNICATGLIGACSDIRYKTNFLPVANALTAVMQLHPIYYNWNKEFSDKGFANERQIGFSAQEVEKLYPEMVQTDKEGYKAIDYSRMTPVLVQAVKEQQVEIKDLKKQNETLLKRIERMEQILLQLK